MQAFEVPKAVYLSEEMWTPENGFLTPTYKIKRDLLKRTFQTQLDGLYAKLASKGKSGGKCFDL